MSIPASDVGTVISDDSGRASIIKTKKKRRAEQTQDNSDGPGLDATPKKKKRKKNKDQQPAQTDAGNLSENASNDIAVGSSNGDNPTYDSSLDPALQDTAISLLTAIVAAATGTPTPDQIFNPALIPPYPYFQPDTLVPMHIPPDGSGSHELVLQALQDLDMDKIAEVLKTLGDAASAASSSGINLAAPEHVANILPPPPTTIPGQVPASSQSILRRDRPSLLAPLVPQSHDHAWLLANKWYNTSKLNELVRTEGLVYRKGKFTATEDQLMKEAVERYRTARQLTEEQLDAVIFSKNGEKDNAFWSEITSAIPMRPIIGVYHHVRRVYHSIKPQGPWLPIEDDRLRSAVDLVGQHWEKVSELVGRRSHDCRDRYRNHIVERDRRNAGAWSKEEEEELTRIVTEMTIQKGRDPDNDIFWGKVSDKMGGKRGRQQCRIKWTDSLSKIYKSDGEKSRWSNQDAYILVHKIDSLDVRDDSEIDWRSLPDPSWNLFSAHVLQRRWFTMKKSVKGYEDMSHQELMDILKAKKASSSNTTPKKRRERQNTSGEPLADSTDPGRFSKKNKGKQRADE